MGMMKDYGNLSRVGLSLFAACSAATGYFLGPFQHLSPVLIPFIGLFLLASGASALNQLQEQDIDKVMTRTRHRPLPSGRMSRNKALVFTITALAAGLSLLSVVHGIFPALLGTFAIFWYNGIYTPLKRKTPFAFLPGGLAGMIPPAVGWVCAGGSLFDPRLIVLSSIFFIWQVPHFLILLLVHGDDYNDAGLPTLAAKMTSSQLSRVAFSWIAAGIIVTLLLPLFGFLKTSFIFFLYLPLTVWMIWTQRSLVIPRSLVFSPLLFRRINFSLLIIMALLSLENILVRIQ